MNRKHTEACLALIDKCLANVAGHRKQILPGGLEDKQVVRIANEYLDDRLVLMERRA